MNFRILLVVLISFFLFRSAGAQDSVKHRQRSSSSASKDSAKLYHTHAVKMPKYARDGYVAIMGGYGIPNNSFASTGNAASGKIFSLSAAFPGIISHSGFAFMFNHGINGINETQLEESLNNQVGYLNIHCSLAGTVGQYYYSTLLTGLYLTYPSKHFTIDARILVGVLFATLPNITVNYYDDIRQTNANYYQSEAFGSAFAFDMGIEIRYPVLRKFCIILAADYLTAAPSFNNVTTGAGLTSTGSITEETGREATVSQSFDLSTFTLGIGYRISAKKPTKFKQNN